MLSFSVLSTVSRHIRTLSTATRIHHFGLPSRPTKAIKLAHIFKKESSSPVWKLVVQLYQPQRLALSSALFENGLRIEQFNAWQVILRQADIARAMKLLAKKKVGVGAHQVDGGEGKSPPSWVMLYLVSAKVRTPQHAEGPMMDFVLPNIESIPVATKGPLLVMAAVQLARFNLLLPMRAIVQEFLRTPLHNPTLEFNLFLQAISTISVPTLESAKQIVAILQAMESRQLTLRSETYKHLLRDRFLNVQLTKYLRERMTREGFVPTAKHLEAYLRVFARQGLIHDAQQYFEAIRTDALNKGSAVPLVSQPTDGGPTGVPHPANVSLLRAHGDRSSAFMYLSKLLDTNQSPEIKAVESADHKAPLSVARSSRTQRTPRFSVKRSIDAYDWTTALVVAANDLSTDWRALVRVFERVRKSNDPSFRPTTVTYTILLRGLYRRNKFDEAEKYWWILLRSGHIIDSHALGIGLQIITRAGRPHEALSMLEAFAFNHSSRFPAPRKRYKPIRIGIIEMNLFMVALTRERRPDIVFKLWDHMHDLYGVQPNHLTLSILLQAVRVSHKLDDSLSGAVAQLAAKNPFRKRRQAPSSRDDVLAMFRSIAGDPDAGLRKYRSGIWDDQPAFEKARKIFLQVMFGEAPETLRAITSPANAVRLTQEHHSLSELASPFGFSRKPAASPTFFDDLLKPDGRSHYPQIVPTNLNCFDYIALLGVCDRASEIPLVLAWMRGLNIQPSRATLGLALAFWVEVSTQAPLIEQLSGGPASSQYTRLVNWMEGWVGKGRMPGDVDMRKWTTVAAQMRDTPR
ncbi:hypothetical protein EYR40_010331 [Pleurotus pulmonarius]|nr:hypothetical protein EYR36_010281 [Pleurotus pulmonarius]KAF4588776.1 hypothetical protein EYR40_010331 [Pleurotus pulmonarius]